jgi:uncharacterized protein YodC (DUF2158 family)
MKEIKVGDVVKFKSGGEKMTVARIDGYKIQVCWFSGRTLQKYTTTRKHLVRSTP